MSYKMINRIVRISHREVDILKLEIIEKCYGDLVNGYIEAVWYSVS